MGFGLLFRLDESSLGSHLNERRVRGEEEATDDYENANLEDKSDSESEKDVADIKSVTDSEMNGKLSADSHKPLSEDFSKDSSQTDLATISSKKEISRDFPVKETSTSNMVDREILSDTSRDGLVAVPPQLEELIDQALELGSVAKPSKLYGTENYQIDLGSDKHLEQSKAAVRDKPYISKAERRKLKKEQKLEDTDSNVEHGKDEPKLKDISANLPAKEDQNVKKGGGQKISRGQKGKLKKIKEKYADQDEEERNIRMALLAVSSVAYMSIRFHPQNNLYFSLMHPPALYLLR